MKSQTVVNNTEQTRRVTRTERRAMARVEQRQHAKRARQGAGRIPLASLIGGALTVLVVPAVFVYGILRSNGSTTTTGAVTDPTTLSPATSLLSGGPTITWWDLIRDLLLMALACVVLVRGAGPLSVDALLAVRRARGYRVGVGRIQAPPVSD